MTKKYLSIVTILFYSASFANIYESNNNGVPTFSDVDTKGAKQITVQKPEVINSYNQISNGTSVNSYEQRRNEIVWKNQRPSEEGSNQDLRNLEGSLENFARNYESQDQSRR